jgi:hypothetical protein
LLLSVPVIYSSAGSCNPVLKPGHGLVSESEGLSDFWFLSDSGFEPESEPAPEFDPVAGSEFVSLSESGYRSVPSWLHLSSAQLLLKKLSFSSSLLFKLIKFNETNLNPRR